jgi:hypothetical protein
MDSLGVGVGLILAAVVLAVFLIVLSEGRNPTGSGSSKTGPLAKFFYQFWGWADYAPKDWSNAPYKRGYDLGSGH